MEPQSSERRVKRYVEVIALHKGDGTTVPLMVIWNDGRCYKVDRVLDTRRAASYKTGGSIGVRYHVQIGSHRTFLYHEKPRWFVEEKVAY